MASDGFPYPVDLPGNFSVVDRPKSGEHWSDCAVHNEPALPAGPCDCGAEDDMEITRILALPDAKILAGTTPERLTTLAAERDQAVGEARVASAIREALSDCSTTDFYNISDEGIANLSKLAARAAVASLAEKKRRE